MKEITIRECAVRACDTLEFNGPQLLFYICREAVLGEPVDWERFNHFSLQAAKSVYEAIAPDIIASATEETKFPGVVNIGSFYGTGERSEELEAE